MRQILKPYVPIAKLLIGMISVTMVAYGLYDEATMQLLVGSAMAIGTAFWQVYDVATTKNPPSE